MRHLKRVSYLIALLGVALVATSLAFDLGGATTLVGMLLIVAGGVKIVIVAMWSGIAGMDAAPADGVSISQSPGLGAQQVGNGHDAAIR